VSTSDTSSEAVEQLAKVHDEVGNNPDRYVMGHPHHWKTSATLRALSAERDAIKAKLAEAVGALNQYQLAAAGYVSVQSARDKADDFLTRHQKETDT